MPRGLLQEAVCGGPGDFHPASIVIQVSRGHHPGASRKEELQASTHGDVRDDGSLLDRDICPSECAILEV